MRPPQQGFQRWLVDGSDMVRAARNDLECSVWSCLRCWVGAWFFCVRTRVSSRLDLRDEDGRLGAALKPSLLRMLDT